jgi:crotonobetainyl-CoA:carnitine CoA-transferase CaiB-like acyl-CoA transferase
MAGPLDGYRVIELTTTVAGPMAAMVLADQGADVIKIEPPIVGDPGRYLGSSRNGMAALFAVLNRNKRSLELNLKDEADLAIFLRLIEGADIFLENYRPGVVEKLGIDFETLSKKNPKLIYASISGYGQTGPYQNRKVFDPSIQATVGISHDQGGERPKNVRTILFDKVTALLTSQALTVALLEREKTGQGRYLPISMLDSALYYTWPDLMWSRTLLGEGVTHMGEIGDWFQIFKTKDGYVSIVLVRDEALEFLSIWRQSTLHEDPRFKTFPDRQANAEALQEAVEGLLAEVSADEVCENLDAFGVPVARVNSLDDVSEDIQVKYAETLIETTHPTIGEMRYPRPPVQFDEEQVFPRRHAPLLGGDTRDVLGEAGVVEEEIVRVEERVLAGRAVLEQMSS